jgi:hypothetical protein
MNGEEPRFEIPKNIERYMAALSRIYEREGRRRRPVHTAADRSVNGERR